MPLGIYWGISVSNIKRNQKGDKKMETVKIIGRISKQGNEYWQTAIKVEGKEESEFIPVFLKKGVEKLNYISMEKKVDKRGVVYTLYEIDKKNVFFPEPEVLEDGTVKRKAIITK